MAKLCNIKGYPFARLSAEEERNYIKDIFYKQQYYNSLLDLAESGVSRFVLGQRGLGKTATILHLFEDMKKKGALPILIDNYKGFPLQKNENYFLYVVIRSLTFSIALHLLEKPKDIKKISKGYKEQLAFFIEAFYEQECASECEFKAKNIEKKQTKNAIKKILNKYFLRFINMSLGISIKMCGELIRNYSGLNIDYSNVASEYVPNFDIETFNRIPMSEMAKWDTSKLMKIIVNLKEMAKLLGYKSVVVMFDKIDEISDINADIEKVTEFLHDFLTDTKLLYEEDIAIIVGLWSEVKKALNKRGLRFDKFKEVDIRWRKEELEKLLNKRLKYFSQNKSIDITLESLVPDSYEKNVILELADHSPRSLLNLMDYIINEESHDGEIAVFSKNAISNGEIMYCKKFDYVSAQPSRTGKGLDLETWIERLLRMQLTQFSFDQYCERNNISKSKGTRHIETLRKYNLIKDIDSEDSMFEITDPRIKHLISRNITSLS